MYASSYDARVKKIQSLLAKTSCDALLVVCQDGVGWEDVRYLTGFAGSSGVFLITWDDAVLFTDSRYSALARENARCRTICCSDVGRKSPLYAALGMVGMNGARKIAYGGKKMGHEVYRSMSETLGETVDLFDLSSAILNLRRSKCDEELRCIRGAVEIARRAFLELLGDVAPGMTEREIAARLAFSILRNGGDFNAPPPILVSSGERTSYPHSYPTDRRIAKGELVMIDFGVRFDGYVCDITRMIYLGDPPGEIERMYSMLVWAQAEAFASLKAGVFVADVDETARSVLRSSGLGKNFVHGIGHGIGLDIHELPSLSSAVRMTLEERDVLTLEPGFYRPGWGGMRVEDDYLITSDGAVCLSKGFENRLYVI